MSAVAGATHSTIAASATKPSVELSSSSTNKAGMSSSTVMTETTRVNGTSAAPPPETTDSGATMNEVRSAAALGDNALKEDHSNNNSNKGETPLPTDIKRILAEVARTGSCAWLPWVRSNTAAKEKDGHAASASASSVEPGPFPSLATSNSNSSGKPPAAAAAGTSNNNNTKYALGAGNRKPYPHSNRFPSTGPGVPKAARKKHRNGVKMNRMRRQVQEGGSKTQTGTAAAAAANAAGSRKRPLFLIRTSASGGVFSPGSVGSGRTSGSEPDDSTQYECDSEGTSATSCSELSTERNRDHHLRSIQRVAMPTSKKPPPANDDAGETTSSQEEYHCLKDVFRMALDMVLNHWYRHKGGYKLSPAEKRRSETVNAEKAKAAAAATATPALVNGDSGHNIHANATNALKPEPQPSMQGGNLKKPPPQTTTKSTPLVSSSEDIFQQRRKRLLQMLGHAGEKSRTRSNPSRAGRFQGEDEGPPFTIQRIAEVLIAPERYYTQTHKLCNCLEKLLLVTSSTSAFGGSTGGITSQSRLEERELAALASEKGRLESEFRQRALKRRNSSLSDDLPLDHGVDSSSRRHGSPSRDELHPIDAKSNDQSPEKKPGDDAESSREMLEAAARSLRTKFDHVGIDPHSSAVANRDVRSIAENRGMTNSPPPPSLAMSAAAASNIALPGHTAVGSFVRQHLPEQNAEHPSIARVPSPILFSQGNESSTIGPLHAPPNIQLLHMHHGHGAPLAGVSVGSSPFDVVTIDAGGSGASAPNATGTNEGADLEGRSSASNSDVDSESDDVSFDDSASDRSDGSDSGHMEPFTAARAMALNRIQQQQRLQNRGGLLTSLALQHQNEGGFRPPNDSEYQSGDSIDSTRGEDSGGSDSSSSDLAD